MDMVWKYKPLDHGGLQNVGQLDYEQQKLPQQVSSGYQDLEPEHQVHTAQKCYPGAKKNKLVRTYPTVNVVNYRMGSSINFYKWMMYWWVGGISFREGKRKSSANVVVLCQGMKLTILCLTWTVDPYMLNATVILCCFLQDLFLCDSCHHSTLKHFHMTVPVQPWLGCTVEVGNLWPTSTWHQPKNSEFVRRFFW